MVIYLHLFYLIRALDCLAREPVNKSKYKKQTNKKCLKFLCSYLKKKEKMP